MAPKPELTLGSGKSMGDAYLLAMWCPVQSRRESGPGFRTELENLVGSAKGKAQVEEPRGRKYRWVARGGLPCSTAEAE